MRRAIVSAFLFASAWGTACSSENGTSDPGAGSAGLPAAGSNGSGAGGATAGSATVGGSSGSGGSGGGVEQGGSSGQAVGGAGGDTAASGGSGGASAGSSGDGGNAGAAKGGMAGGASGSAGDAPVSCDAGEKPAIGGLGIETALTSSELVGMTYAVQPPDSDDWYLVEQRGRIVVFADGALRPTPFFDVRAQITLDASYDERGLHSIAFPPDFATSGLFYIVMTPTSGANANRDLVLEHRLSTSDPYVADMTPVREILSLEGAPTSVGMFANLHNAYTAKFGPDGMLYVGMGDGGGSCNDNPGFEDRPQDIASPNGKLLRLDPSADAPYGAADNPFVNDGDPRVLHYGLRNPFRFGWDAVTGDLYIGDVGQDTHEELDVAPAGAKGLNFGWASEEGDEATCPGRALRDGATVTPPIFFTSHGGGSGLAPACSASPFCDYSAIVAGAVYRGTGLPALQGVYLFGDWAGDNLAALYHCGDQTSDVTVIDYVRDANLPDDGYLVKVGTNVPDLDSLTAIVEDHARELYLVVNGNSLLKIVPAP